MTTAQLRLINTLLSKLDIIADADRYRALSALTKREVESSAHLTPAEFEGAKNDLLAYISWEPAERTAQVDILTRPVADPWATPEPLKEAS